MLKNKKNRKREKRKILLIKMDMVGDFVVWTDAAREYRRRYPIDKLVLLCNKAVVPIAKKMDIFDEIIEVNWDKFVKANFNIGFHIRLILPNKKSISAFQEIIHVIQRVRMQKYDIVIQTMLIWGVFFWLPNVIALFCRADKKIAYCDKNVVAYRQLQRFIMSFFDKVVQAPPGKTKELMKSAWLIRNCQNPNFKCRLPVLQAEKEHKMKMFGEYFVIVPGASEDIRKWSAKKFAEVAEYIYSKTSWKCVIVGSKQERSIAREVIKYSSQDFYVDTTGLTDTWDAVNIIGDSKLVVSNDTGGVHIAVATATPSVCIKTACPNTFLPYFVEEITEEEKKILPRVVDVSKDYVKCAGITCQQYRRKNQAAPCIQDVQSEAVMKLVDKVLEDYGII